MVAHPRYQRPRQDRVLVATIRRQSLKHLTHHCSLMEDGGLGLEVGQENLFRQVLDEGLDQTGSVDDIEEDGINFC